MKVIVYTINLGAYDKIYEPQKVEGYDYLYYTDTHYTQTSWKQVKILTEGDISRVSRFYKINSHLLPPHDISVYLDGNMKVNSRLKELVDQFSKSRYHVMMYGHPQRNCTYAEARVCKNINKDDHYFIDKQMEKYRDAGLKENAGLFACGFILRKNTANVEYFNDKWHAELKAGSKRDQLSCVFSAWKTKMNIKRIRGSVYNSEYYKYVGHNIQV